jgi:hypothetical protein
MAPARDGGFAQRVLLVADLLHPVDRLAVEPSWMAMWLIAVVGGALGAAFGV